MSTGCEEDVITGRKDGGEDPRSFNLSSVERQTQDAPVTALTSGQDMQCAVIQAVSMFSKITACSTCDICNPKTLHTVKYNHALLSACKTVIGIVCDTH
jgi:hypothetical protein